MTNETGLDIRYLKIELATEKTPVSLTAGPAHLEAVHVFDEDSIHAVNAALASGRPLLVRGEPGVGKSQLARAAAKELDRVFLHHPVDIQTEAKDLLWHFDSIERLAKAQVAGALNVHCAEQAPSHPADHHRDTIRTELANSKFLHPGRLWWAFNWESAMQQAVWAGSSIPFFEEGTEKNGCVILIDEIDKAETDVPNGLLEALGAGQFTPAAQSQAVCADENRPFPLVVITTNEERALPDAFLRRCLVLNLELPRKREALEELLVQRGERHFPKVEKAVLEKAAKMLVDDREAARKHELRPLPGQAEYLDLLRALDKRHRGEPERQEELLKVIAKFALRKHGPDQSARDDELAMRSLARREGRLGPHPRGRSHRKFG